MLDGEVGDTAARIEHEGRDKGLGWTDCHATSAAAAVLGLLWRAGRQWDIGIDLAKKKPGTCRLVNQHGVFRNPSETSLFGDGTL